MCCGHDDDSGFIGCGMWILCGVYECSSISKWKWVGFEMSVFRESKWSVRWRNCYAGGGGAVLSRIIETIFGSNGIGWGLKEPLNTERVHLIQFCRRNDHIRISNKLFLGSIFNGFFNCNVFRTMFKTYSFKKVSLTEPVKTWSLTKVVGIVLSVSK